MLDDLVTRTAAIAERARAAEPTREELRERMPQMRAFVDEWRKHTGQPVYYELSENGLRYFWLDPAKGPGWLAERAKGRAVQISPPAPVPPKRRGEK